MCFTLILPLVLHLTPINKHYSAITKHGAPSAPSTIVSTDKHAAKLENDSIKTLDCTPHVLSYSAVERRNNGAARPQSPDCEVEKQTPDRSLESKVTEDEEDDNGQ